MNEGNDQLAFETALCARVKRLREDRGWTAEQMAIALGIPAERYRKYESRSPLPQYLIERFAQTVNRTIEFVLTGRDRRHAKALLSEPTAEEMAAAFAKILAWQKVATPAQAREIAELALEAAQEPLIAPEDPSIRPRQPEEAGMKSRRSSGPKPDQK